MVAGYGQDDKVCSYCSLMAICETTAPKKTAVCLLVDKEEIGSVGNTGMESLAFETFLGELIHLCGEDNTPNILHRLYQHSAMLSADVDAAFDPLYASVADKKNASFFGYGVGMNKYTGGRGKGGKSAVERLVARGSSRTMWVIILFAALALPADYVGMFMTYRLACTNYNAAYGALQVGLEQIEAAYEFDAIDLDQLRTE